MASPVQPRLLHSQLQCDVRIDPIAEVLDDVFRADVGVLDLVRQVFDDFEQDHSAADEPRSNAWTHRWSILHLLFSAS